MTVRDPSPYVPKQREPTTPLLQERVKTREAREEVKKVKEEPDAA
jgi:hypothetical protein